MRRLAILVLVLSLGVACGRAQSLMDRFRPAPTPSPTPGWVGKVQEEATPLATFQSRVGDTDGKTGQRLSGVPLREAPGRGAPSNGTAVQSGERIFIVGTDVVGGERFYKVRSFDGLRRGWVAESVLPPQERPQL